MAKRRTTIGKLPPKYKFVLNPYKDFRASSCTICRRPTHMRKFALMIHIDDWGFLALGKTCRYCSLCELIIAHQDELETELVECFERTAPHVIGNPYLVFGTTDKKKWKASLGTGGTPLNESLDYTAAFKDVLTLKYERGGWAPPKKK